MDYKHNNKFPKLGVASSSLVYRSLRKTLKIKKLLSKGGYKNRLFLLYSTFRIGLLGALRGI